MVAFFAGTLGRLAVAEFQPRQHGFADVNAAVIDDIRLHHFPSVRLLNLSDGVTEEVIPHMPEVQRFVGVRRGVLDHHKLMAIRLASVIRVGVYRFELFYPETVCYTKVQKTLHGVVFGDDTCLLPLCG